MGILFMLIPFFAFGQDKTKEEEALKQWKAGEKVSVESVIRFGLEQCFCVTPLTDEVFNRMRGKSYKADCTIKRNDLRYIKVLHRNARQEIRLGEMVCHKSIAQDLVHIFEVLYEARYPIERMVLVDEYEASDDRSMADNNSSCFNYRRIAGSKRLSRHSMGMAVDINPLYNPHVTKRKDGTTRCNPATSKAYMNRKTEYPYMIKPNDLCCKLFKKYGFTWGGDWKSSKDYQHFEHAANPS